MVTVIGGVLLKNKSLRLKIMFYYGLMSILLIVIIFSNLKNAFYDYYYDDIFNMLTSAVNENDSLKLNDTFLGNDLSNPYKIQILIFNEVDSNITSSIVTDNFSDPSLLLLEHIQEDVKNQNDLLKNYIVELNDNKLFYVIKKDYEVLNIGKNSYKRHIVALRWNTNNIELKNKLLSKAIVIISISFIVVTAFAYIASRMITHPLSSLVKSVKKIGNRNLSEPIDIHGNDEISEMGYAIEDMRIKLYEYEKHEKFKLHSISHELKTPIMVIKSYLDCFKTDKFINNDKLKTISILQSECDNMETLINDLLMIQKLDHLSQLNFKREQVDLFSLIEKNISRYNITDLDIVNNTKDCELSFNFDHLNTLIENILSNQVRYANSKILIESFINDEVMTITFINDGPQILNIDKIFDIFHKGENGKTGLGLYICKKILSLYGGLIEAENTDNGVLFNIKLPIQNI